MYGQMIEKDTMPDLKEGFYVAQDLPADHPQVLTKKFAHGPNLWPSLWAITSATLAWST